MTLNGHTVSIELNVSAANPPARHYPIHFHPIYEAHISLGGHVRYEISGQPYVIGPGMVLLHPPQQHHQWWGGEDSWIIMVLWFAIDPPPPVPLPAAWPIMPDVLQELELLLLDYQQREQGWKDRARARMTTIVSRILCLAEMAPIAQRAVTPDDILLEHLRTYLQQQLTYPVQVADIARHAGMSVRSLHRWFRRHTGQSIMEYLLDLRMQTAAQYLMCTERPLPQIAEAVGITDPSYFCRRFRQYFHVSPMHYRKGPAPRFLTEEPVT